MLQSPIPVSRSGVMLGPTIMSGLDIELAAAGQLHTGDRLAGSVMRRMAIPACSESINQISATLAVGLRHAARGGRAEQRGGAKTRHQQNAGSWPARRHLRLLAPGRLQRA